MKTHFASADEIASQQKWFVVDATDKTVGRLASSIAHVLRGKNKPIYAAHQDTGDFVVVINAEKVKLTGKKFSQKIYRYYTGFIGGLKEQVAQDVLQQKPEQIIEHAVAGMLPKNILGRAQLKKLHVYRGAEHPHQAQQPQPLSI